MSLLTRVATVRLSYHVTLLPRDIVLRMEEEVLLLCLLWRHRRNKKKKKTRRRFWVRQIVQKRRDQGEFHNLLQEMRLNDPESHFRYLRMSKATFDRLLARVGPLLSRRGYRSDHRPDISPNERLALTIRYLATGSSQMSLSFNFRIGRSTVCSILQETCSAIWDVLCTEFCSVSIHHLL